VAGGLLHVAERHAGVERSGDEGVTERVGATRLTIPARWAIRRTIRPAAWRSMRLPSVPTKIGPPQRSLTARSMARAVRGAGRHAMVTTLPPLAHDRERAVTVLEPKVFDVSANGLGDPQPSRAPRRTISLISAVVSGAWR
jgi:hypothetical protein